MTLAFRKDEFHESPFRFVLRTQNGLIREPQNTLNTRKREASLTSKLPLSGLCDSLPSVVRGFSGIPRIPRLSLLALVLAQPGNEFLEVGLVELVLTKGEPICLTLGTLSTK